MFIHLHTVYGRFHATMAEVSGFDRDHMALSLKYLPCGPSQNHVFRIISDFFFKDSPVRSSTFFQRFDSELLLHSFPVFKNLFSQR